MSDTLDALWSSLSDISASIRGLRDERQGYLDKADEIQQVYNQLKGDKDTIKEYRKSIKTMYGETYPDFQGSVFNYRYHPQIKNLLDSYDLVVDNIDTNLDNLNNEILSYKNKASDCIGPLGSLESAYNYISTKIENWTN